MAAERAERELQELKSRKLLHSRTKSVEVAA